MPRFFSTLLGQVCVALGLGVAVGWLVPDFAVRLRPLGDGFVGLITMAVAPLTFCVIVHGIAGSGDIGKVCRIGGKAILYFEPVTALALAFGVAATLLFTPGAGMHIDATLLDRGMLASSQSIPGRLMEPTGLLLRLIPTSVIDAFARSDILQVLLFSILFGVGLATLGARAKPLVDVIGLSGEALFKVVSLVVKLAPLGVLGAIAFMVGRHGVAPLEQMAWFVALFYATAAFFVLVVLGGVMRIAGFDILGLLRLLQEELLIVLGTTSSDSVLLQVMDKLRQMGVGEATVGVVLPAAYSFNLVGFSIYLTMAAIFIAQATGTPLSVGDLLLLAGVSLLTTKGARGVPGSAIVVLAATLSAVPAIPAVGVALVLSVDWFLGIARALANVVGCCVATIVVAAWEGDIDRVRARQVLKGSSVDTDATVGRDPLPPATVAPAQVAGHQASAGGQDPASG